MSMSTPRRDKGILSVLEKGFGPNPIVARRMSRRSCYAANLAPQHATAQLELVCHNTAPVGAQQLVDARGRRGEDRGRRVE